MLEFLVVEHLPQLELNFWSGPESQDHSKELGWLEPDQDKAVFCGVRIALVQEQHDPPFFLVFPAKMLRQQNLLHVRLQSLLRVRLIQLLEGVLRPVLNLRCRSERASPSLEPEGGPRLIVTGSELSHETLMGFPLVRPHKHVERVLRKADKSDYPAEEFPLLLSPFFKPVSATRALSELSHIPRIQPGGLLSQVFVRRWLDAQPEFPGIIKVLRRGQINLALGEPFQLVLFG